MSKKVKRLYRQFQPSHYDLHLQLDPEQLTFSGTVTIKGAKVDRPSERLTFHQSDLKITGAEITRHDKRGDRSIAVKRINRHETFQEVRLHADSPLYPGEYTVTMHFKGTITRPMNGIYPCFFEHDGKQKKLIATQFESHHAREAFPCIDEPEAKATFDLTLTTPKVKAIVANTPVKHQFKEKDLVTTSFETTPRMSTYLLAFVFGEMDYKESKTKDGVAVRTYATPDNIAYTDFALECAVKTLEFYNDYFDIPYPLPKCDFLALPDFAAGAMENWGCITFREQALLVDPANTSLPLKQYVVMVVAHELTHQWFGNLVTMRWWNDLWLNESFATWMSYLATDELFPEWQFWMQFLVDEQQAAFRPDALDNTHPIEVQINHPDEIRTIFDAISYEKGASILQMLHDYLGAGMFRDGLRLYLKEHAYGNTDTTDLWAALEAISQKSVTSFMGSWTGQPGFPILRVAVEDKELNLHQERFYLNPSSKKDKEATWPIPLNTNEALSLASLNKKSATLRLPADHHQLVLNEHHAGFYRVIYNSSHLQKLGEAVRAGRLSPLDRLGILSDVFEAAKADYLGSADALKLLESYGNEDNALVWDIISMNLSSVRGVMDDEDLREAMKPYVRKLIAKQLERLGWDERPDDTHFDKLLRPTILALASVAEEADVVAEARRRFEQASKPEDIVPDLRGVVYGTVAREGGEAEFDKLLEMHNTTSSSEERVTLSAALTAFKQPGLIKRALALIPSDTVRLQDAGYWIAYSFMNRHAKQQTWEWMQSHWAWLDKNLGKDLSFSRMPIYVARAFSDIDFLPKFNAFFDKHNTPALDRSIKQGVEIIEWQSAWKARDLKEIKAFFKA
jgi:aminopeptidase N